MTEKILITGGAGFIGHHTANKLAGEGHKVRIIDNLNKQVHPDPKESLSRLDPAVEFICGDIRDRSQLQAALEGVDAVYHFAAETGVGQSMYEIERYSDVNIQGTAVLCDCIAKGKNRPNKLILASSRAVYGEGRYKCDSCGDVYPEPRAQAQLEAGNWDPSCPHCGAAITPVPTHETSPCQPLSIYSITKEVQENLFKMVSGAYQVPVVILRYFNVYGAGQSVSNPYTGVLSIFASRLLANKDIEIYEDGRMERDFVPIHDVVNANAKVLELDVPGVLALNIGLGVSKTIMQVAESLKTEIGSQSNIALSGRYRVGDIRHCYADMSKAFDFVGEISNDSYERGIRDLISWARHEKGVAELEQSLAELSKYGLTATDTSSLADKN
ncbi:SDR family NAD(P)-dependent oxidoreductase [Thermodesulfobacteriota bacterium]